MTWWFLLWIPVCYIVVSFMEWWVHKYHMHRKGFMNYVDRTLYSGHAKKHHVVFSPKSNNPTKEELDEIPHSLWDLLKIGSVFAFPILGIGLLTNSTDIILGCPLILLLAISWAYAWNWFHIRIHLPKWKPGNAITRYLKWYHDVHHYNQSKNFNALFLGFDWIMGTYSNKLN